MSIHWPIESEYGKELARWNTPRNVVVKDSNDEPLKDSQTGEFIRGKKCVGYEEYPRMMYMAHRLPNGQPSAGEIQPHPAFCLSREEYEQRCAYIDQFNRECQRIVRDESEQRLAEAQGWRKTTTAALDLYEQQQQEIARAAAEAEYRAQRMSSKARREWDGVQDQSSEHVVDVTTKKRGPGRPRKVVAVAPMAGTIPARPGAPSQ